MSDRRYPTPDSPGIVSSLESDRDTVQGDDIPPSHYPYESLDTQDKQSTNPFAAIYARSPSAMRRNVVPPFPIGQRHSANATLPMRSPNNQPSGRMMNSEYQNASKADTSPHSPGSLPEDEGESKRALEPSSYTAKLEQDNLALQETVSSLTQKVTQLNEDKLSLEGLLKSHGIPIKSSE